MASKDVKQPSLAFASCQRLSYVQRSWHRNSDVFFTQQVLRSHQPTTRSPDKWDSARFQAVFVAWDCFHYNGVISSHQQVTHTVGQRIVIGVCYACVG